MDLRSIDLDMIFDESSCRHEANQRPVPVDFSKRMPAKRLRLTENSRLLPRQAVEIMTEW